jgi:hypothetical protein
LASRKLPEGFKFRESDQDHESWMFKVHEVIRRDMYEAVPALSRLNVSNVMEQEENYEDKGGKRLRRN